MVKTFQGVPDALYFCKIGPIRLRSIEDSSIFIDNQLINERDFVNINVNCYDYLPLEFVVKQMASIGISMYADANGIDVLTRPDTIWAHGHDSRQFDMIIGQDLLSKHFLVSPTQPNIRISDGLIMQLTQFGLSFIGEFAEDKFLQWMQSVKDRNDENNLISTIELAQKKVKHGIAKEVRELLTWDITKLFSQTFKRK